MELKSKLEIENYILNNCNYDNFDYTINNDLSVEININKNTNLFCHGIKINELPFKIKSISNNNKFYSSSKAQLSLCNLGLTTLKGLPKKISCVLDLSNNKIQDLEYLPTKAEKIILNNNQIKIIDLYLTDYDIKTLELCDNEISEIKTLNGMIENLIIDKNQLVSVNIKNKYLKKFSASYNKIRNINIESELLNTLLLEKNELTSFPSLKTKEHIEINLNHNNINNIIFKNKINIDSLIIRHNPLLENIESNEQIEIVQLHTDNINIFNKIKSNIDIDELHISNVREESANVLINRNLKLLNITYSSIKNINFYSNNQQTISELLLTDLSLININIEKNILIQKMDINNNYIQKIDHIINRYNLKQLDASMNLISGDIIIDNKSLEYINLENNDINSIYLKKINNDYNLFSINIKSNPINKINGYEYEKFDYINISKTNIEKENYQHYAQEYVTTYNENNTMETAYSIVKTNEEKSILLNEIKKNNVNIKKKL